MFDFEMPEFNMPALGLTLFFWLLMVGLMSWSGTFHAIPWTQSTLIIVLSLPAIYGVALWQLNK